MERRVEKHKAYTANFKLKVIKTAEERGKHYAAKMYKIDRKRVREWCQQKRKIETLEAGQKKASGAGRPLRYADIEKKLNQWFFERREAGVRVTGKALRMEAMRLHKENGCQSFKASNGWFWRFKKRNYISFRRTTHIRQKSVEITNGLVDRFLRYVIRMRRLREYSDMDIGNMDETPIYLEMPGKNTYACRGDEEVSVTSTGREKVKFTVTLGAYADGTKMAPLIHLPGVRPLPKKDIPTGIVVFMCGAGKKSWATEQSIIFWLQKLWGRNNTRRRMLVWDAFRAHLTPKVKDHVRQICNTDLCVIPGGCTSILQPADVSWNRPFKVRMAEFYDTWLFEGEVEKTPAGNRKPPPKPLVLQWIKDAWCSITPDMIRKSFKKCGITSALDGSEDNIFQQQSDDDDQGSQEFEGFSQEDIDIGEQVLENVTEFVLSESEEEVDSSDSERASTDCDSPGH